MAEREPRTTKIDVGALARVEGEGALHVSVRGDTVEDVRLEIYEPPRFFEALLRDRPLADAPDITSRICGICPIAYQMSACAAIEDALGVEVPEPIWDLRRLIYCGEWLESHALHVFMLHAPDFLGYEGAIEMARDGHSELVERGLRIKRAGNELLRAVGGRAVHPINLRVGGFYRAPAPTELAPVRRGAQGHARGPARDRALGRLARVPAAHARDRAGRAAQRRLVPDRARPPRLDRGARHRPGRVPRARDRGARPALDRPARADPRPRQLRARPDRALRAQPRIGSRRWPATPPSRPASTAPAGTRSR